MEDKNKLYVGEKIFDSSSYQASIFNEIEHGAGNMVITAAAGSAKTTTIENCLRFIPEDKRKIFLAFNVSTVEKLKEEIPDTHGTMIVTFHGLGNRILRENGIIEGNCVVDDFKYSRYVKSEINSLSVFGETSSLGILSMPYMNNIISMINYARYYNAIRLMDIKKVADIYGILPIRDEFDIVRKALIWGKEHTEIIDHTDMIWLPCELELVTKKYLYDFIFIDEAQDTTIAHQALVDKCFKRGTRFIAVGDPKQQINVWCGASEEAIDNYKNRPNTKEYKLPISYRCPKKITEMARKYSPDIVSAEWAEDGVIRYDVSANDARPGDLVLCRIMSELLEQYMSYLRINKKAYLRGHDAVKSTYLDIIKSVKAKYIDSKCLTENGLIPQLYRLLLNRIDAYTKAMGISEDDAVYHPEIFNLYDSIEAIKVLAEGMTTVDELIDKINIIFSGDDKDAIILSTVHKAKGQEADNVFILAPSLMPSQIATKAWEVASEENLIYVAITRAHKTLNYIKEYESGFFKHFKTSKGIKNKIAEIQNKLNSEKTVEMSVPKTAIECVKTVEKKKNKKLEFWNFAEK